MRTGRFQSGWKEGGGKGEGRTLAWRQRGRPHMTEDRRKKGGAGLFFFNANFSLPLHSPVTILSSSTVSLKSHFRSGRIRHPPRPLKAIRQTIPPTQLPPTPPPAPTEPIHRAPFVGLVAPGVGGGRKEEKGGRDDGRRA